MMNRTLVLILFCLSLFETNAQQRLGSNWLSFENPQHKFQFLYPPSWKTKDTPEESIIYPDLATSSATNPQLIVTVYTNENDTSLNYIQKVHDKLLKDISSRPNFRLVKSSIGYSDSYPELVLDYTYSASKKDTQQIHTVMRMINKDKSIYRIMYKGYRSADVTYLPTALDVSETFLFTNDHSSLSLENIKGKWEGTISESLPNAPVSPPVHYTIIFNNYIPSSKTLETIQYVENPATKKTDTLYKNIEALVTEDWLLIPYTQNIAGKSNCFIKLKLHYNFRNGVHSLEGNSGKEDVCFNVSLSLRKSNTGPAYTKSSEPVTIPADKPAVPIRAAQDNNTAKSNKGSASLPEARNAVFKIDPKDVTGPSDKAFKWYSWQKAPESIKLASKSIQTLPETTLYDFVQEILSNKCEVQVAAIDLNGDAIAGLCIQVSDCSFYCGTAGCLFGLYENGGMMKVDLGLDEGVKPTRNGVLSSKGNFFSLKTDTHTPRDQEEIKKLFSYKQTSVTTQAPLPNGPLLGGETPDELGQKIFRALQTNDKSLFISLIHPHPYEDDRAKIASNFDRLREEFAEKGLVRWPLAKYSRSTYTKNSYFGSDDGGERNGEQVRRSFTVEFSYNNKEFIGRIEGGTIVTFNKKYYIWNGGFSSLYLRYQ